MENPQNAPKLSLQLCKQIFDCQLEIQIGNVNENLVSKTIELYVAMSIYMNHASSFSNRPSTMANMVTTRGYEYYQQKIKKLLLRKDVQQCLLGYKTNPKAIGLQIELSKVKDSAPEQAKALVNYFKKYHRQQEDFIKKTVDQQNSKLQQRIARRSRSRSNSTIIKQNSSFIITNLR